MNKLILIFISLLLTYSPLTHAHTESHSIYTGYLLGKIKGDTAKGTIISYRYEPESTWGLLVSLLYLKANDKEPFNDPRFSLSSTINYKSEAIALLVGPTYRITPQISVYAQMGPSTLKHREDKYHPEINITDSHHVDTTSAIGQVGVDYNPIKNIALNLGYLYSDSTANKRHLELHSLQLSLGYRF